MCTHRPRGIWARIWGGWLTAFALSFAALETTGLLEEGTPGTCSFFLRRLLGTEPPADGEQPCCHRHAGRIILVAVLVWLALHLGWGLLGIGGAARASMRDPCRALTRPT